MPTSPRYCARCGGALSTATRDGRPRRVCPGCGLIHYQNPLPVAAAVVLDEQRRVLLVRRAQEPLAGMWCLPIGFAELEEDIAAAALRELAEEAGVHGRVARLLGAESTAVEPYGDLLIVTFEVAADDLGAARAGDDAAALGWFELDALPPLAFAPNASALAACAAAHRDEWAIADSYARLLAGSARPDRPSPPAAGPALPAPPGAQAPRGPELLSESMLRLLRDQAPRISARWLADIARHPSTPTYHDLDPAPLRRAAETALGQLTSWLGGGEADEQVRRFYRALGAERAAQGVPLPELISSLSLLRKALYDQAHEQGVWSAPLDLYRVLELDRRFVAFFDQVLYHIAVGYQQAAADRAG